MKTDERYLEQFCGAHSTRLQVRVRVPDPSFARWAGSLR